MPRITEYYRSRSGSISKSDPRFVIVYKVTGTMDHNVAVTLASYTAPETVQSNGKLLGNRTIDWDLEEWGVWTITVNYSHESGKEEYSFEFGGGNVHRTHSLETVQQKAASGFTAENFRQAIGFDGQSINGVDTVAPVYNFNINFAVAQSNMTDGYKNAIYQTVGKVNSAWFKGKERGTVLFMGASGSVRADEDWNIGFRFAASPNITNLTIGDITGIDKEGWQYLWLYFKDEQGTSELLKKPVQCNVERVYDYWNFGSLGLGS